MWFASLLVAFLPLEYEIALGTPGQNHVTCVHHSILMYNGINYRQ